MSYSLISNKESESKYFAISTVIHLSAFLFIYLTTLSLSIFFSDNKIDLTMIETSIKVDVVSMPTMTVKELKILSQDTSEWTKIKNEDTTKKDQKSFMDTLKKLSNRKTKKSKIKIKKKNKPKFSKSSSKKLKALIAAGNKLSQGSNLTGTKNSAEDGTELSNYSDTIVNLVKTFWILPSYLAGQSLTCSVRIYINSDGEVIKLTITESSGVKEYDEQAIRSIKQASPFPQVPASIQNKLTRGNITLGFPL